MKVRWIVFHSLFCTNDIFCQYLGELVRFKETFLLHANFPMAANVYSMVKPPDILKGLAG